MDKSNLDLLSSNSYHRFLQQSSTITVPFKDFSHHLGFAPEKLIHKRREALKNVHPLNPHLKSHSQREILEQQAPSFSGIHLFSSDEHGRSQKKSLSLILKGLNSGNEAQNSQVFQDP